MDTFDRVDAVTPDSELLDLDIGRDPAEDVDIRLLTALLFNGEVAPFGTMFDNFLFGMVEFDIVTIESGGPIVVGCSVMTLSPEPF